MKSNITFLLIFVVAIFSCKNEPKPQPDLTETEPKQVDVETPDKTETVFKPDSNKELKNPLVKISTPVKEFGLTHIVTQQQERYHWPAAAGTDTTTIIILRHGETQPGKTSLAPEGQIRGGRLANIAKNAKISGVFYSNNSEIQMGQHIAKVAEADFSHYKKEKPADILEKIKSGYKGRRSILIGSLESSTDFVNRLAGGSIIQQVAVDYYDKVYVCYVVDNQLVGGYEIDLFKVL